MKKKTSIVIVFLAVISALCLFAVVIKIYGPNFGIYLKPPSTKEYVEKALEYMNDGIYAGGEEWQKAKEDALEKANSAKSYEDTYDILNDALKVAGGKHSAIISLERQKESVKSQNMPECNMNNGILYIKIPAYDMQSGKSKEYTETVISFIKANMNDCKGIIVDLRGNTGGDMGPMVAAISPLLQDGLLMSFDIHGNKSNVELKNGTVTGGGSVTSVENFKIPQKRFAVLQNERTGSSGEATLLCFKGLQNVKTFGKNSGGYCSVNTTYFLYDKALVLLTIGKYVDRLGNEYCEDPIVVDFETENPVEDAVAWISQ